jgi:phosphate transport system permease protein
MSEDAMASVPNKIREGALGLGATKLEVAIKVVLPAIIVSPIALETANTIEAKIPEAAAGNTTLIATSNLVAPNPLNLTGSIQTMTGYIVQVATGDATFGSDVYYSIYA